jgi:hypothetical protein
LKNPPHGTRHASDGGRVICETKCIWSHYLLLDREKSLSNLVPSLRKGAGPLQPIDATMQLCRTDYPASPGLAGSLYNSKVRLTGFFNSLLGIRDGSIRQVPVVPSAMLIIGLLVGTVRMRLFEQLHLKDLEPQVIEFCQHALQSLAPPST